MLLTSNVLFCLSSLQEGDFLVLPSSVKLDGTKLLIDEVLGIPPSDKESHVGNGPSDSSQTSNVLKLNSQKGKY